MFDLTTYQGLIAAVNGASTNTIKGESFENLCEYLLSKLDGVEIQGRDEDMTAEEIDLVLWNAQTEDVMKAFEKVVLIECKNWSKPADAKTLDSFISKMRRRQLKTGIFIAANGVTGDFLNSGRSDGAIEIIKSALHEGIKVIIINKDDLDAITNIDQFKVLIKKRYCGLFVHKLFNN